VRDRDASAQSPTSAFLSAKETFQKRQYKGYKNFSKIRVRFFIRASGRVALAVSNPFYGN
jgi:hypothetical protein